MSYYDYYQPEAYMPSSDTYIEKDSSRNEEIDRLRHSATKALFERRDVVIVASVSCIYGLGSPEEYGKEVLTLRRGETRKRDKVLRFLTDIFYERNDFQLGRGKFRVRGDTLDVHPAGDDVTVRVEFWGDVVERITEIDGLTGEILAERPSVDIFPAKHFVTSQERLRAAIGTIEIELEERLQDLDRTGKLLEAARLRQRTHFDIEMLQEVGFCHGVENYSRHLTGREAGSPPWTLMDYFPDDFLMIIDESHMTIPQVHGMYHGDMARKQTLVDFGFRLPSAMDNRPLKWDEFQEFVHNVIYVSATPGPYEYEHSQQVVEQLVRPTGLIDPEVEVRPTKNQIDDLLAEIQERIKRNERALVTTLTKRMAEDLADYLREVGVRVHYIHSDIDTFERIDILRDLRLGVYDVVVGINLLREGLDLPEVSLVAILDADKEGYLRSTTALVQTTGRAARHELGRVIMYADTVTDSMERAIRETYRRRQAQIAWNEEHGITPKGIQKAIRDISPHLRQVAETTVEYGTGTFDRQQVLRAIKELEAEMKRAARELEFEQAAMLRDQISELRRGVEAAGKDDSSSRLASDTDASGGPAVPTPSPAPHRGLYRRSRRG